MGNTACHFAQRSKPVRCSFALLGSGSDIERHVRHLGARIAFGLR
ncbi:hypothetical protein [Mesorhizobium caraganae]|nr:hypothetical protein [Mesorhizobium caraganae]